MKTITVKLPGTPPVTLAASGFCSPCEAATLQAQTAAVQKTFQNNAGEVETSTATEIRWSGPLGFESQFTGDGRYINRGALRWEASQLPMPLRWTPSDLGSHGGAMVVGLIETLEVRENGEVWGTGFIDYSTEEGFKVVEGLRSGLYKGVSMDLDEMSFEIRVKAEVLAAIEKEMAEIEHAIMNDQEIPEPPKEEADPNGYVKVYEQKALEEVMYVTDALVRAATIVDIPAFKDAYVKLDDVDDVVEQVNSDRSMVAAAPLAPSAEWFSDPDLDGPTPLTFTKDGRVFGHIALWGTCHTGFSGSCVTAPPSMTNYALFRTGALITAEGTEVAVGRITMDTGHAALSLGAAPAAAHYDNTGNAVADVSAGEDAHGIWVAGALRSTVTDEQLRALRSSPMSGDWRTSGGNLELVSVLAVNLPGFPVPRVSAMVASGRTASLIRPTEVPIVEDQVKAPTLVETFAKAAQKARRASLAKKVGE